LPCGSTLPAWRRNQNPNRQADKVAARLRPLGFVEAINADEAIEKGAVEYKIPADKLIAIRRP
jgi:hypothetical protein